MSEEWRPVKEYEGLYEVSSYGNVRSLPRFAKDRYGNYTLPVYEKILKQVLHGTGYLVVSLYNIHNGYSSRKVHRVHQLVASSFIGIQSDGQHVMHLDSNKRNNHASNLRYGSAMCNMAFQVDMGTFVYGDKVGTSKLCSTDVLKIRKMLALGLSGAKIGRIFNVSRTTVCGIKNNKAWKNI